MACHGVCKMRIAEIPKSRFCVFDIWKIVLLTSAGVCGRHKPDCDRLTLQLSVSVCDSHEKKDVKGIIFGIGRIFSLCRLHFRAYGA